MYTYQQLTSNSKIIDLSGIDNPKDWLFKNFDLPNVFYPVKLKQEVILSVDQINTDLESFIRVNSQEEDVEALTEEQLNMVCNLEVGESVYIGICSVERLS